jgi:hypothetical protein
MQYRLKRDVEDGIFLEVCHTVDLYRYIDYFGNAGLLNLIGDEAAYVSGVAEKAFRCRVRETENAKDDEFSLVLDIDQEPQPSLEQVYIKREFAAQILQKAREPGQQKQLEGERARWQTARRDDTAAYNAMMGDLEGKEREEQHLAILAGDACGAKRHAVQLQAGRDNYLAYEITMEKLMTGDSCDRGDGQEEKACEKENDVDGEEEEIDYEQRSEQKRHALILAGAPGPARSHAVMIQGQIGYQDAMMSATTPTERRRRHDLIVLGVGHAAKYGRRLDKQKAGYHGVKGIGLDVDALAAGITGRLPYIWYEV